MTRLCLIRHGQTDFNIQGRWQGHSDIPLNETGLEQARRAAEALAAESFTVAYSSDLQRARVTADFIAQKHSLTVQTDPRLREISMGEWEGQLLSEIPTRYPQVWAERQYNPLDASAPGGESLRQVSARVYSAVSDICSKNEPQACILIVAHGLSLASFLCLAQHLPLAQAYERIPKNATPIYLDWAASPS